VIDVSNPTAPVEVGFLEIVVMYSAVDVAVSGLYAYVNDSVSLRVIDVSTPSAPVEIGIHDVGWGSSDAGGVAVSGQYAYVAGWPSLQVLTSCEGLLFTDGFESGDTSRWSAMVP